MTNLSGANLNNGAAVGPQGEGKESPSTFPRYPAYKDSGVEWLGVVPEHWGVSPLKWLAEQITDKATTSEFQVGLENIEGWTGRFIETDTEFAGDGITFRQEDILFGKLRPYLAKVWLADRPGQAVGDFFVLRPRAVNSEFLHKYILTPTVIEDLNASTIGAKMPRVGWEDMAALAVTLPPHKEQTQIARFLDHETARIDALIEEQQRLIELLKEKRQAVISHVVTKGLDPTVPMKDSGVEWLGEVPAHWTVAPVKFFFEFLDGQRIPIKAEDRGAMQGDYPYYGASGIIDYVNDFIFEEDLVLVSEDGANLLMRSTPIAFVARGKYWVNNHAHIIRPQDENLTYWAEVIEQQDLTNYVTGSAQPKLTAEALGSIKIAVPPTGSERAAIQAFILKRDADLGALLSEAASGVRLLQERRSALISAAVTGKIDVRGWQPPASTQTPEFEVAEAH